MDFGSVLLIIWISIFAIFLIINAIFWLMVPFWIRNMKNSLKNIEKYITAKYEIVEQ